MLKVRKLSSPSRLWVTCQERALSINQEGKTMKLLRKIPRKWKCESPYTEWQSQICLIKHLTLNRWKAAANVFLVHEPTCKDLLIALNRSVNKQFSDYCRSETFLEGREVDELAAISNTLVMKKTEEYLPLWNACIRGSCGTNPEGDKTATNIIALATATATRHRVKDLSALHFRIPTLLSHEGISFEGAVRLNRLGICMSPQQMVHLQRVMVIFHYCICFIIVSCHFWNFFHFLLHCSFNLEFINANVSGEMAQLIISNQDRYVPQEMALEKSSVKFPCMETNCLRSTQGMSNGHLELKIVHLNN